MNKKQTQTICFSTHVVSKSP